MRYVAWVVQNGEGCDYTIGCGHNLYTLEAETKEEAFAEVREMVLQTIHREWAERYEAITVYEISDALQAHVEGMYKQEEERLATLAAREIEQKERALYEKLKDKYAEEAKDENVAGG